MKDSLEKGIKDFSLHLDDPNIKNIDRDKLSLFAKDISLGIKNYVIFQNFFYFKWPYWLYNTYSIKYKTFHHITPFLLLNNNNRDWISFSNHLSKPVYIDLTGMISFPNDYWSVELWILERDILFRPQERVSSVMQNRNLDTFLINTKWKEANFKLEESIYGSKQDTEELVIEINSIAQKSNIPQRLFIAIRPYNTLSLGSIESIEYNHKTKLIRINGSDRIYLETKPDYLLVGNAYLCDIDFANLNKKTGNIKCKFGMATLAAGYNLKKGDNENKVRISLTGERNFKPHKINYLKIKKDYSEAVQLKSKRGLKLIFPEKTFQNWIYGAKISALYKIDEYASKSTDSNNYGLKSIFYTVLGYNRMGFFSESLKIIDLAENKIDLKGKLDFSNVLDRCYLINSISDYFKLSRDIDFIKSKYKFLRNIADYIIQYSYGIKDNKIKYNKNSIPEYLIQEYHIYDILIISFAIFEFSYLARCIGIFNDELKFIKESQRLEEIIINDINTFLSNSNENQEVKGLEEEKEENEEDEITGKDKKRNEYFAYIIFAGYPFSVKSLPFEQLKILANKISELFDENPLYFKSLGGCDTLFSIIYAINLLIVKNSRVHSIIEKFFEFGKERYVLPDFINPNTGCGIMGLGDSKTAISAFFTLLRSVIFIDSQERLEIFPVPKKEWFASGSEIKIENAPSIFGMINFSALSTSNDVQLHFYEMPKYIPPEIMINLPFPTKIKHEDDFILKKKNGNSYLIHGWPSMVRFLKK